MFRDGYTNSFKRVITARFLAFISSLIRKYLYLKNFLISNVKQCTFYP